MAEESSHASVSLNSSHNNLGIFCATRESMGDYDVTGGAGGGGKEQLSRSSENCLASYCYTDRPYVCALIEISLLMYWLVELEERHPHTKTRK
jgi:hypothetical protein